MADEIEISSREDLNDWLQDKPYEWTHLIAIRTALRILPMISWFQNIQLTENAKDELTSIVFRACFTSLTARRYPSQDMEQAMIAAADAANNAESVADTATHAAIDAITNVDAAADALLAIVSVAAFPASSELVAKVTDFAASAIAFFGTYVANNVNSGNLKEIKFWNAVNSDTRMLEKRNGNMSPGDVVREMSGLKLWNEGDSNWIFNEHTQLFSLPYGNIQVWQNWYERVLVGRAPFGFGAEADERLAVKIALQDNEFWDREFGTINNDISDWIEEARLKAAPPVDVEMPQEPEAGPGPQYGLRDGQLSAIGTPPVGDEVHSQEALHELLCKALALLSDETLKGMHNTHPRLASTIAEYGELLSVETADINVTGLWSVGGALASYAAAYREQNQAGTMSIPLEPETAGALQDVVRQHGAFILGFEVGADLVNRADRFALDTARLKEIEEPGNSLLNGLSDNAELVDEPTRKLHQPVRDAVHEFGWATSRTGHAAYLTVRNAVRALIKLSVGKDPSLGSILGLAAAGSVVMGDGDMQFVRQAFLYLQTYGPQLLVFFRHSPEMYSYVEWMLHVLDKVEIRRDPD